LEFATPDDYEDIEQNDEISIPRFRRGVSAGLVAAKNLRSGREYTLRANFTERERAVVLAGGVINHYRMSGRKNPN
jgi:hypothetical protein